MHSHFFSHALPYGMEPSEWSLYFPAIPAFYALPILQSCATLRNGARLVSIILSRCTCTPCTHVSTILSYPTWCTVWSSPEWPQYPLQLKKLLHSRSLHFEVPRPSWHIYRATDQGPRTIPVPVLLRNKNLRVPVLHIDTVTFVLLTL